MILKNSYQNSIVCRVGLIFVTLPDNNDNNDDETFRQKLRPKRFRCFATQDGLLALAFEKGLSIF